jgi:hypothetical protein
MVRFAREDDSIEFTTPILRMQTRWAGVTIFLCLMLMSSCKPAALAWLSVPHELDGAQVWVDGEMRVCVSERVAIFDLESGRHQLIVRKPGYMDVTIDVDTENEGELYLGVLDSQVIPINGGVDLPRVDGQPE